ncbi:MBL fold metallo-hydrolase [Desulfofustis limnaeus]|jgi:phosphoribosyl 1,2-cyclic phosphodiesterase|uniref:MBL fold metallo-hydrolase n=1 Tax=Desulfofustis limnaeus TaxID=2740163 RepID=A0ABN6M4F1_9BACT|nr:MBL fold metallo-hydrolase [Desulfofustis limnaeus]MDX9894436.1 MBL fold metallo-hydrolase [Desulfofustis sp.]BDD87783.1 MBL fold metallo-hydrolase [Desulfofustis limnaeus]
MRFAVLGSGSRGNSIYIETNECAILVDGGFSGREIAQRLRLIDRDTDRLAALFVTHEHQDHIAGIGVLSRRCRLPVFANAPTFRGAGTTLTKLAQRNEFQTGDTIICRDLRIRSFSISHDAGDPVGFIVEDGTHRLGICTDTGIASRLIERRLSGCHALVLEFNHDQEMLQNGPYPLPLKQRVRSNRGHLSNTDAASLLAALRHDGLQQVVLAHLSETNNLPEIAFKEARAVLSSGEMAVLLDIASQWQPTRLFSLD